VTRRAALPSLVEVRTAITELTEAAGKPPTILALARHLGLANTTFRRNFPDTAAELSDQRSRLAPPESPDGMSRHDKLQRDNDKLRRDTHELTAHLELAIASIQRLALDNEQLRRTLEATGKITRIDPASRTS
jgi:hypothetical protein